MINEALMVWLLAQAVIELLLCGSILYLLYGGKRNKKEVTLETEKVKKLMLSCNRVVHKHHALSDLWEKVETRGAALKACMNDSDRKHNSSAGISGVRNHFAGQRGISSYEKTARLLEKGVPVGDIAAQVGLPRGEVELIMNLRKR